MQGEHRHAHAGDVLDALRYRVVDVEQLHVEEDLLALGGKLAGEFEPACEGQLVADLVERHCIAKFGDDLLGLGHRRHVEADDQPVPHSGSHDRVHGSILDECSRACVIKVEQSRAMPLRSRSSLKFPSSSKASPAVGTETCGAMTSIWI